MAINTTITYQAFNPLAHGSVNLNFASTTGFAAGTLLGIGGDLAIQLINELPNFQWKCEVIREPAGSHRSIIRKGDAVTDGTIPS